MSDNHTEQHATRTIQTRDLESGEDLLIAYFPREGIVTINGYAVTRAPEHEVDDSKAVFHRSLGDKLFTVSADSLTQLYI